MLWMIISFGAEEKKMCTTLKEHDVQLIPAWWQTSVKKKILAILEKRGWLGVSFVSSFCFADLANNRCSPDTAGARRGARVRARAGTKSQTCYFFLLKRRAIGAHGRMGQPQRAMPGLPCMDFSVNKRHYQVWQQLCQPKSFLGDFEENVPTRGIMVLLQKRVKWQIWPNSHGQDWGRF